MEQVNSNITVPEATGFVHKYISQNSLQVCPAMLPFVQPLVVAMNSDKKYALFLTSPNTNQNTLGPKMVATMINNLLSNVLTLNKKGSSEFGQDMKVLLIDMTPQDDDDVVSPFFYLVMGIHL